MVVTEKGDNCRTSSVGVTGFGADAVGRPLHFGAQHRQAAEFSGEDLFPRRARFVVGDAAGA